jgi:hypothetical protein
MLVFILLFAPGIIASAYYCALKKIPYRSVDFIVYAFVFIFLINLFVVGIVYLRGHGAALAETLFLSIGNILKYGAFALAAALAFPNILYVITRFGRNKK